MAAGVGGEELARGLLFAAADQHFGLGDDRERQPQNRQHDQHEQNREVGAAGLGPAGVPAEIGDG